MGEDELEEENLFHWRMVRILWRSISPRFVRWLCRLAVTQEQ